MSAAVTGPRPIGDAAAAPQSSTGRLPAWAPAATCAALVMLGGLAVALIGVHITAWTLDETGYKVSAVHYRHGLPDTLFNDYTARATSRLYSLTLMPLFALLDGDVAIRVAKVYNCVLWCSIAVPLWHLARPLLTPWRRVAAVTLSVIAPWMVYTTALFTEALALAGFVWFTWAALCALRRPAWWRDLAALLAFTVAVTGRTQLGGILLGYLGLLVLVLVRRSRAAGGPSWWRARVVARELRHYPFSTAVALAGCAALAKFAASGELSARANRILGGYDQTRVHYFHDAFPMVSVEILGIGTGLGIVAVLFAVPWYTRTLADRGADEVWWFAAVTAAVTLMLVAFTAWGQGGYWGTISEERYWMYPFVFAWIGAFRAAQERSVRARDVAWVGIVLVVVAGLTAPPRELDTQGVFFAPVLSTLGSAASHGIHRLTQTPADAVALALLVVCGAVWLTVRRAPWIRLEWVLGGGAILQLALTVVPFLAMTGHLVDGKAQRTGGGFAQLGWVDRRLGHTTAVWLDSEPRRDQALLQGAQLTTLLWNGRIESRGGVADSTPFPDINPLDALPLKTHPVDERTGALRGVAGGTPVLVWQDSPYVQPVGQQLAASPGYPQLRLRQLGAQPRLQFRTEGLTGPDAVPASGPGAKAATFDVWPAGTAAQITLTFVGSPAADTVMLKRDGAAAEAVPIAPGAAVTRTFTVCGPHAEGSLQTTGAKPTTALAVVEMAPAAACERHGGSGR
jgi:hypothetical protein